jgi:predicted permease
VLHITMAAAVAFGVVTLFGFTGTLRSVFILMCMMPASVTTYLWVEVYQPDEAPAVAGFVMASTLLAVVVLPLVLVFWV